MGAMPELNYITAGESHGPAMLTVINGLPAALKIDSQFINHELARRQGGYGRGARQQIELDQINILSGIRHGHTIGSPITLQIANKDSRIDDLAKTPEVNHPRPGHADLAGSIKWLTTDCRNTLERASARETAARVAAGAVAKLLLLQFGIKIFGFVRSIYNVALDDNFTVTQPLLDQLIKLRDDSEVYCPDPDITIKMKQAIHQAKIDKDTLGGIIECHVLNCPIGIGSSVNWYEKLDSLIAAAVMGIQAFKGVEIGLGFAATRKPGSQVHDPIFYDNNNQKNSSPTFGFTRSSNNAGGLEGGMTNGMPVVVKAAMKPISTLLKGLPSVDLNTKTAQTSHYERSDICAVSAASVVLENVVAFEIARAFCRKFSGDSMPELHAQYNAFMNLARKLPLT